MKKKGFSLVSCSRYSGSVQYYNILKRKKGNGQKDHKIESGWSNMNRCYKRAKQSTGDISDR